MVLHSICSRCSASHSVYKPIICQERAWYEGCFGLCECPCSQLILNELSFLHILCCWFLAVYLRQRSKHLTRFGLWFTPLCDIP